MEENNTLKWIYTGSDFLAQTLKAELEAHGIATLVQSDLESARMAGFGSSGLAQVFVALEHYEKATPLVALFQQNQKSP